MRFNEWSKEEEQLLKDNYQNYTDDEIVQLFLPNRTKKSIWAKANRMGLPPKTEETHKKSIEKMSETKRNYYKIHDNYNKGKKFSEESKRKMSEAKKRIGKWKGEDNPRHKTPLFGKDNGRWQGGITDLYRGLRNELWQWQKDSMEFCKYKCVVTNDEFDDIHHIIPYKDIMFLTFENLNLEMKKSVQDYSENEFKLICEELNRLHFFYGYGACLDKDIHKLFHDQYGYTKFEVNDFLNFIDQINNGYFDEWFAEHNKQIKINYNYINYLKTILFNSEEKVG